MGHVRLYTNHFSVDQGPHLLILEPEARQLGDWMQRLAPFGGETFPGTETYWRVAQSLIARPEVRLLLAELHDVSLRRALPPDTRYRTRRGSGEQIVLADMTVDLRAARRFVNDYRLPIMQAVLIPGGGHQVENDSVARDDVFEFGWDGEALQAPREIMRTTMAQGCLALCHDVYNLDTADPVVIGGSPTKISEVLAFSGVQVELRQEQFDQALLHALFEDWS